MNTPITDAKTGASHNRGRSKQYYGTPWTLIRAVEQKWGPLVADLAASQENAKASDWIDEATDSFNVSWSARWPHGNLWLNPPFANIGPWAERCAFHASRRCGLIFLLTPASIGTDWFRARVFPNAMVLGISPHITFEGTKDPYPKDLMLSVFGKATKGFDLWRWT